MRPRSGSVTDHDIGNEILVRTSMSYLICWRRATCQPTKGWEAYVRLFRKLGYTRFGKDDSDRCESSQELLIDTSMTVKLYGRYLAKLHHVKQ
jgi:hypothetical protein